MVVRDVASIRSFQGSLGGRGRFGPHVRFRDHLSLESASIMMGRTDGRAFRGIKCDCEANGALESSEEQVERVHSNRQDWLSFCDISTHRRFFQHNEG